MAGSTITGAGSDAPGMTLRAWAYVQGTTGTVMSGLGCTVARTTAGNYTLTLTQALASINALVVCKGNPTSVGGQQPTFGSSVVNATTVNLATGTLSGTADLNFYVAVYQ